MRESLGAATPKPEEVLGAGSEQSGASSPNFGISPPNLVSSSPNFAWTPDPSGERDEDGCLVDDRLAPPVIDDLQRLTPRAREVLEALACEPRAKGKVDRAVLIDTILALCTGHFVTLRCLAELVNRKPDTLRDQYLSRLVRERKRSLAFPTAPTHKRQAYCTTTSLPQ